MPPPEDVTGVLLAGGRSRRLGRHKALEPFGGEPLMARVAGRVAGVCSELVVVVAEERQARELPIPAGARVVADVYPGKGPLGGIHSGLQAASNPWAIVVACDMPFLNAALLRYILSLREGCDAVVPLVGGRPEPTHAAYSRACLPAIQERLERGDLKIGHLLEQVRATYVPEEQLRRFDPELLAFFNVNTRDDLARALTLAKQGR